MRRINRKWSAREIALLKQGIREQQPIEWFVEQLPDRSRSTIIVNKSKIYRRIMGKSIRQAVTLTVSVNPSIHSYLNQSASDKGLSKSAVVRSIIAKHMRENPLS